jgi:hypothetical protein
MSERRLGSKGVNALQQAGQNHHHQTVAHWQLSIYHIFPLLHLQVSSLRIYLSICPSEDYLLSFVILLDIPATRIP